MIRVKLHKTLNERIITLILAILAALSSVSATAQEWSQATACPGWNNPTNFTTSNSDFYYSGQTGQKENQAPNVLSQYTGINWNGPVLSDWQMDTASVSTCGSYQALPSYGNIFAIMSTSSQATGSPVNRDPNTGDTLPFVPTQFNTVDTDNPVFTTNLTHSIRIGDNCAGNSQRNAVSLRYNMKVRPNNAMLYIYYAIVAESPGHGTDGDPSFIIRVMKKNAANQWVQVSDTLAYAITSTPSNVPGGTVTAGEDGWHSYGSGYGATYFKEWTKTAINLSQYLYENIRIEMMVSDCIWTAHKGYAYVAGECGPAQLQTAGCPAGADTIVTVLKAPRNMVNYEWYASECGQLPSGQEGDAAYTWRPLSAGDNDTNYRALASDFRVTRRLDGTACDSIGSRQTFRCDVTSALDPAKPFSTSFYLTVQNRKPVMDIDTLYVNDSVIRFRNRSYVPGDTSLVQLDSTQWLFFSNSSASGTPVLESTGDSVDYPFNSHVAHSAVVRTFTSDSGCWSEAAYIIPPKLTNYNTCTACPEVRIIQKYDHIPRYGQFGWDTVVDCNNHSVELTSTPCIPVQYFNGYYTVDEIPYNPPDTTFYLNGQGMKMSINADDIFAAAPVSLGFPFFFFGIQKNQFRIGDNGLVTFTNNTDYTQDGGTHFCPYNYSAPIPWTPSTVGAPNMFNRTHDAIYGVYEDTYIGPGGSYLTGNQGIYYGVVDDYPCRKIIASWNEIPVYNNWLNRQSYQIVCYEGSNIIEVHVKRRGCCPSMSGGRGTIGIQNATGLPQVPGTAGSTNMHVQNGAPAAFWPDGMNPLTASLDSVAYRFSPQGSTNYVEQWYRIFDDGQEAAELSNYASDPLAIMDTNGYFIPLNTSSTTPPSARAFVSPTVTSRYVYRIRFQNANQDWYDLSDTITIGIDTLNTLTIKNAEMNDVSEDSLCFGEERTYVLAMNALQDTQQIVWVVSRSNDGSSTAVPQSMLHLDTMRVVGGNRLMGFSINSSEIYGGTAPTSTDTITVTCMVNFTNGCMAYSQIKLAVSPSVIEDSVAVVCDSLIWYGTTYRNSTVATHNAAEGCAVKRLTLTVNLPTDTSFTHYVIENNLPYVWNGISFGTDTTGCKLTLNNSVDCDSNITFSLTVHRNQDTTIDLTVCEGLLPLLWNGVTFYLSETDSTNTITHQTTIPTIHGADSLITMRLHILYNSTDTISDTIRQNDLPSFTPPLPVTVSYTQDENDPALVTIIDSTVIIPNAVGCDSLVYYTLYLYRNYHTYDSVTVCDNQLPVAYLDTTFSLDSTDTLPLSNTVRRVFTITRQSVFGTDSAISVTVTVHPTYEVSDTIVACPYESYIYDGVDYGGPVDFDAIFPSINKCDSLVHVSLQARDSLFRLAPLMSFDSNIWYPADTTLIGCDPQNFWLDDTSTSVSREWAFWSAASASDTTFDTLNIFDTVLPIGIYSFRIIAVGAEGCVDTLQRDSAIHIFKRPKSDFIFEPDIVPFHDPKLTLEPQAEPADSLTYRWLIALDNQGGQYDTVEHDEGVNGLWHYTWEPLTDSGHYDVALVAYWTRTVTIDTLTFTGYCTDTAHHPVPIVNTFLQFPSLVTPNGDGTNDTWEVVNLIEMGQYPNNEVWIYNQWGALVFHAKNIDSHEQCWDPNATNSPDGTYFFRFSGKGRYGVIKQNGVIEVLR